MLPGALLKLKQLPSKTLIAKYVPQKFHKKRPPTNNKTGLFAHFQEFPLPKTGT